MHHPPQYKYMYMYLSFINIFLNCSSVTSLLLPFALYKSSTKISASLQTNTNCPIFCIVLMNQARVSIFFFISYQCPPIILKSEHFTVQDLLITCTLLLIKFQFTRLAILVIWENVVLTQSKSCSQINTFVAFQNTTVHHFRNDSVQHSFALHARKREERTAAIF